MTWRQELHSYKQLQNYNGCPLYVSADFFVKFEKFYSIEYEISEMVSQKLNFTTVKLAEDEEYGENIRSYIFNSQIVFDQ
jgi:hypothetical protein